MEEAKGEKLVTSICTSLIVYLSTKGPAAMETGFQSLLHSGSHMERDSEREKWGKQERDPNPEETNPSTPFENSTHLFCGTLGHAGQQAGLAALAHTIFNLLGPS